MPLRLTPPRPTLARPEKPTKKPRRKPQRRDIGTVLAGGILPKSRIITITKKAIIPNTASSQKISSR